MSRAEEEKRMAQRKKEEEERRQREIEEKKQRDIEEKRQRLEEAEKKRQAMLASNREKDKKGPNFTISKKDNQVKINKISKFKQNMSNLKINFSSTSPLPNLKGTRPKNNWKKKREFHCPSVSNHLPLKDSVNINFVPKLKNFGIALLNLKQKNTILKKGKNVKTTM